MSDHPDLSQLEDSEVLGHEEHKCSSFFNNLIGSKPKEAEEFSLDRGHPADVIAGE